MKDKEYIVKDVEGGLIEEEEIIRCKDCKHNKSNEWVDCPIKEFFGRTLDNYCSLAERKAE